jgi:hypothetical protein
MLLLFGGKYKEPARLVLGVVLLVVGLLIQHGVLLVAVGAVLAVWGVFGTAAMFRRRGRGDQDGRAR